MNNKGKIPWGFWVLIAVVILIALSSIGYYNSFATLNQNVNGKWSEVESQYQRQADLIPNLVSVVSSSVSAETNFIKDVTAARTSWANAANQVEKDRAGQQMNNGISAFVNAVSENYPTLAANTQYVALTDELAGTQNRITVARGEYIRSIQTFNTAIVRFPGNMLARMFGFSEKEYYKADVGALNTPKLGSGQLP